MTEPLTLTHRLERRAKTMNGSLVGASDGNTYAIGYYDQFAAADDKEAADELDRLTEANKKLTAKVEEAMADWSKAATNGIAEFKRAETAEANLAKVEAENERLREALEPSGSTKAAYSGEFYERIEIGNPNFEDSEDDDEPETIMQPVLVSWTTIKAVMAAISARAALTGKE